MEDVWSYASPIMVQGQDNVDKLFEAFKIKNGADRFVDPAMEEIASFLLSSTTHLGLLQPLEVYPGQQFIS
jgi:hypothetical protein